MRYILKWAAEFLDCDILLRHRIVRRTETQTSPVNPPPTSGQPHRVYYLQHLYVPESPRASLLQIRRPAATGTIATERIGVRLLRKTCS